MFDVSFGELSLVGLIALAVLGPQEMFRIYKALKKALSEVKDSLEKQLKILDEDEDDLIDITMDDEGRPQKAYKLDKILEKMKNDRQ